MGSVRVNIAGTAEPTVIVRAYGDIDQDTTDQLRHALVDAIMHGEARRLVVDLDGVTALDPLTIGGLQAAVVTAQVMGRAIAFHTSASPLARRLSSAGIEDGRIAT